MKIDRTSLIKMGNFIANKRKAKGYTQKQLAEIIDVGDKTISKWEQGDLAPDITLLKTLSEVLDTNIDSIVNGRDNNTFFSYSFFKSKRRLLLFSLVFTLIVLLLCLFFNDRGKCELYRLSSSNPFTVEGYLVNNGNQSVLMIGKIKTNDINNNIKNDTIKSATITIYSNDKVIETKYFDFKHPSMIEKFFNDNSFLVSSNTKFNKEDIRIKYEFLNLDGSKFEYFSVFK